MQREIEATEVQQRESGEQQQEEVEFGVLGYQMEFQSLLQKSKNLGNGRV